MKVIAISGWAKSGKDTATDRLIKGEHCRVAFADPLKEMVAQEYGIPLEHCHDQAFKEQPILHLPVTPKDTFTTMLAKLMFREFRDEHGRQPMDFHIDVSGAFVGVMSQKMVFGIPDTKQLYWTPRALCILKGSTNRAVQSDYWVETAIQSIKRQAHPSNGYKGFVISDLRYKSELGQLRKAFGKDLVTVRINRHETCPSTDASERDLDDATFDVVIENKGTLEEFLEQVEKL